MASSLGSAFRSFWHTMTSNDRHASHDSPYRTGQHVPLSQNRNAPLTSIATSALESRPDLTFFEDDPAKRSSSPGWSGSQGGVTSPVRPYSPGMRSLSSQHRRSNELNSPDGVATEIQMQSFHDGAPPPPPVSHSWRKIDRWAETHYEELYDQLGEGCTQNDVNELEHELDCTLPLEVRESLQIHDGQERGGRPTGIIFGCMLLDCEEIVQEWRNWRTVNEEFLSTSSFPPLQQPTKAFGGSSAPSSSSAPPPPPAQTGPNPLWRQELLDKQDSQPPKAIQKAYAHPSWIPLARDWGGNNIAVDLAPGPAGKWGQVIIFGRDYDCKYVVARSWAGFLAIVADDLCSPKSFVDDDSGELKLKQFKQPGVEPPYLEILRWRTDQKYGRRPPRRKTPNGLGVNTGVNGNRDSPYGSPTAAASGDERGRSPHRFPSRGPNASPKTAFGVSSPLARVTEETTSPVNPGGSNKNHNNNKIDGSASVNADAAKKADSLVDAASFTTTTTTAATSMTDTSKSDLIPTEPADTDPSPAPSKEKEKEKSKRRSNLTSPDANALEGMKSIAI
ncbi:1,3-beta-glucan biosynthesis protein [Blastomyces gilchristii SLH14081]|uniref:1,3-beta-glucan biosynthesis protein n=1 Tax=Blastomyces gilchristii (strain SLH14081) TaxID=559298 RepID=A0A179V1P9_BLAGS|nr:1,3-beta-glucan biosynthesis protein [Blastomyces gilchristii SLH14081]OAT13327.1 1,3-beta-glucan biosynthesis protein [Blastomyces gilchristii SLH14081]